MKRAKKQIVRAVRVLTDPQPNFVSHVRNGANQTPARILKTDDANQPVQTGQAKEASMAKAKTATKTKKAPATTTAPAAAPALERKVDVQSIFFALDKFEDEPAVKAYLAEHGYTTDALIEKDGVGWTVKGSDFDQFEDGLKEIEAADGVTITVGYLKADSEAAPAAKAEGEQPEQEVETPQEADGAEAAEKAAAAVDGAGADIDADAAGDEDESEEDAETVALAAEPAAASTPVQPAYADLNAALVALDATMPGAKAALTMLAAREATSKTDAEAVRKFEKLTDVLSYMDDVPPGFYDLMQAFSVVVRYAMQDKDLGRVRKAARDMGEYIIQLADLFAVEAGDDAAKSAAVPAAAAAPVAVPAPAKKQPHITIGDRARDTILKGLAPKEAPAPAVEVAAEVTATEDEDETDPVLKAIKALGSRMDNLGSRVEQIAAAQAPAEGSEAAPLIRGRKGEDEGAAPVTPSKKEEKVKRYIDDVPNDRLFRNTMGLPQAKH